MVRRVDDSYLLTPSDSEIREVCEKMQLTKYSKDLVKDFAALDAGGVLRDMDDMREEILEDAVKSIRQSNNNFQAFYGEVKVKSEDYDTVLAKQVNTIEKYNYNLIEFMQEQKDQLIRFDGSPLERSVQLIKLASAMEPPSDSNQDSEGDAPLPLFQDAQGGNQLADLIEEFRNLDQIDKQMLEQEPSTSKQTGYKKVDEIIQYKDSALKDIMELARNVNHIIPRPSLSVMVPDRNGTVTRTRYNKSFEEVQKALQQDLSKYANPKTRKLFLYKAATQQINIREKCILSEKKQFIYILLDGSGSMSDKKKINSALGIVYNRIKGVVNKESEVWVSSFESSLSDKTYIATTPEEAYDVFEKIRASSFNGGGTDIAASIREAIVRTKKVLEDNPNLIKPELVVITDEDSSSESLRDEEWAGFVIHGFSVKSTNENLSKLCSRTGGRFKDRF